MRPQRFIAFLLKLFLAASPADAAGASAVETPPARTLAVVPFYSSEKIWQLYMPLIEYLQRETGEAWELKLYKDHEATIAGVCRGEVDLALLGPVPLGRVNSECGAFPVLVPLGKNGKPENHAMLVTGDPAVTTIDGLRGKKVGLLKGSTVAHTLALKMLGDAGLGPGAFEPVFYPGQDQIMTALLKREVSGAAVKETLYRRFEKEPLRLLLTSEALPNFAFAALPSRPPARRERFLAALLKLRPLESAADAETVKGWDDEIRNGFTTPAPGFLPAVLKVYGYSQTVPHESR